MENYNSLKRNEKTEQEKPEEPPFKVFYIPGNSSSVSFMNSLQANQFTGIIFETEADTIAQTFKNDWGSYSDILRKAFHHENTGLMRKDRYIEIKEPRLAVVLSGTPEQVHNLMPSTENGLFSRFLYYAFEDEGEFKNSFEKRTGHNFKEYFTEKGNEIFELFNYLNSLDKPIIFR